MTHTKVLGTMFGLALAVAAALSVPTMVAAAGGPPQDRGTGMGQNLAVTGELDAEEQAILAEFLIDEHKALATYEAIMADFGEVAPFSMIARAEQQHIAALERVFTRYGVELPRIPAFDVPSFGSVQEAAAAAVQAEIDNAGLYDRRLSGIDNADVVRVATNLRNASLNQHLPAFQAAADGTYVAGEGLGAQNMAGASGTGMMGGRGRGMSGATQGLGQGTQLRTADGTCPAYQSGTFQGR